MIVSTKSHRPRVVINATLAGPDVPRLFDSVSGAPFYPLHVRIQFSRNGNGRWMPASNFRFAGAGDTVAYASASQYRPLMEALRPDIGTGPAVVETEIAL